MSDSPKYRGDDKARQNERGLFEAPIIQEGHSGHRQRLRARFLNGGADAMPDYELLELVLFRAIPRRDTKDIAKRLLARFGSFSDVINAAEGRLKEVKGVGDSVVSELKPPLFGAWCLCYISPVISYLTAAQAFEQKEQFRILFLDRKNRLIIDEVQSEGTVNHTPVYIREVVKRALDHSASAILLVHNHPSGDPTPSRADIEMTKQISTAAQPLGITVHDHIIIGRDGHASFKALRLL